MEKNMFKTYLKAIYETLHIIEARMYWYVLETVHTITYVKTPEERLV